MSRKDKLLQRLLSKPKDFTWNELETLLKGLGYEKLQGKGSRVKFYREKPRKIISLHQPHPKPILLDYMVKEVIETLKEAGDINEYV